MTKGVIIVSGGMDSVTLAHMQAVNHDSGELIFLSFNYGQRHIKELEFAGMCADRLRANWVQVPMMFLSRLLKGSSLTDPTVAVPDGHYAEDTMKQTVVPNRNAIMLNVAVGVAIANDCQYVATGVHAGDHFIYPDCRPEFVAALQHMVRVGNEGFAPLGFHISAPFMMHSKADIVKFGSELPNPVPYELTWSCYKGGAIHCGVCGTCTERREAFIVAGVDDPTEYADLTTEHLEKSAT